MAVVVGGIALGAAAGLLAGKLLFDGDNSADGVATAGSPPIAELPEVSADTARATMDFLDGDGRVLLEITSTADRLRTAVDGGAAGCTAMTDDLNERYPADSMLDRLRAMPDPVLGEWLSTYYGSAFGALDACTRQQSPTDYLADADTALTQIDRRIAQLKAAK
ncbi:MAG: hypothetical protein M3422_16535 [Actinomycetota bacterium]|nr:hypothetical protein [Actinomycetota bacterium]